MIKNIKNSFNEIWGESKLGGGGDCFHIVFLSRGPCLNVNHVIIMINFHNVIVYYDRSKPKKRKEK
jgi:hypothetical protein